MAKRALKKYLSDLPKEELATQLLDLYERFPIVKEYYDFVFNPKEDQLIQEAKAKISNEYFPLKRKRPKARRSIAQKRIKHFITLGVDAPLVADVMLYNLEIAQAFSIGRNLPDAFFKSMLNSYQQAIQYIALNGLNHEFKERILNVYQDTQEQHWPYAESFSQALDMIDP